MEQHVIRLWAKKNGIRVADRGRLSAEIINAYQKAVAGVAEARDSSESTAQIRVPSRELTKFPFVLEDGTRVTFELPLTLRKKDAERIARYVAAIAQPDE